MTRVKGKVSEQNSESSAPSDSSQLLPKLERFDLRNQPALHHALDTFVGTFCLTDIGLLEDTSLSNFKLILGSLAVLLAVGTYFLPEGSPSSLVLALVVVFFTVQIFFHLIYLRLERGVVLNSRSLGQTEQYWDSLSYSPESMAEAEEKLALLRLGLKPALSPKSESKQSYHRGEGNALRQRKGAAAKSPSQSSESSASGQWASSSSPDDWFVQLSTSWPRYQESYSITLSLQPVAERGVVSSMVKGNDVPNNRKVTKTIHVSQLFDSTGVRLDDKLKEETLELWRKFSESVVLPTLRG